MEFWNDELRVCPKCKAKVSLRDEPQTPCPACGATVRFYNYRPLPPLPPEPEETPPKRLFDSPTTTLLLGVTAFFGLVTLVAIHQHLIVASVSVLSAIGFAVFGFLRDRDARRVEERLEKLELVAKSAAATRGRLQDAVGRYNALLSTGDRRVEHYHDDLYGRSVREKEAAQSLRDAAARERAEAKAEVEKARDEVLREREAARADVSKARSDAARTCEAAEERLYAMAERFIDDHRKWTSAKMRPDPENYQRRKNELEKAFNFVEKVGYRVPPRLRKESLAKLREDFERVMREFALKEEQKRINQRMREEDRIRREREEVVWEAEERERELQRRLEESLREMQADLRNHTATHDAQVEELRRQLAEAHANAERAKSMAQLTKAGHVYVLSNIGSFGENVFKVGMTRRLEPDERVKELGDASVPFPFDVHAMISCENAPALENTLHRELTRHRVNRVNLRKEFFKVDLETILGLVRQHHGEVEYVAEPEALEYRDSMETTPDEVVELDKELAEIGVSTEDSDE